MNPKYLRFAIAGAVLLGGLAYLAYAASQGGLVYHLTVDQFLANSQYRDQRVRLCGTVAADDFAVNSAGLSARFILTGIRSRINVQYHGVIPDLFKPQGEVVVEGHLNSSGVFQADALMTKCASKYQSMKDRADAGGAS